MRIHIRQAQLSDIEIIRSLVFDIWPVAYGSILTKGQIDYMLELVYSKEALIHQMNNGHHFIIVEDDDEPVAFADYGELETGIYKLHKLYALPSQQGKGLGKLMLNYIITKARGNNATSLRLNVNRHNTAKAFYEHLGFTVFYEDDIDIGNGYFMNDYIMSLKL